MRWRMVRCGAGPGREGKGNAGLDTKTGTRMNRPAEYAKKEKKTKNCGAAGIKKTTCSTHISDWENAVDTRTPTGQDTYF